MFQPRAALRQGELVIGGAEALARWRRQGEEVPPSKFIALAESGGLVRDIARALDRDRRADALCESIPRIGEALGKRVIAEGVESREQLDHLAARGCREFQGCYLGRPLPPEEFPPRPSARRPATAT